MRALELRRNSIPFTAKKYTKAIRIISSPLRMMLVTPGLKFFQRCSYHDDLSWVRTGINLTPFPAAMQGTFIIFYSLFSPA
jgi:hypothetical protein